MPETKVIPLDKHVQPFLAAAIADVPGATSRLPPMNLSPDPDVLRQRSKKMTW